MALKPINSKTKLFKMLDILIQKTDEETTISTKELIKELAKEGIKCERKTLYSDIATLNDAGFEIITERGRENNYKYVDRQFTIPEIRIMLDAIQSAYFISEKATQDLSKVFLTFLSKKTQKKMKRNKLSSTPKTNNECVLYNVWEIEQAINNRHKVSFDYCEYNFNWELKEKKGKETYEVDPLNLVFYGNKYYLVAYVGKSEIIKTFRIDKIKNTKMLPELIEDNEVISEFSIDEYIKTSMGMFKPEEIETVTLLCDNQKKNNKLLTQLRDQFGEDIEFEDTEEDFFKAKVTVGISNIFFSWLVIYGGQISIVEPQHVKDKFKERLITILENYETEID